MTTNKNPYEGQSWDEIEKEWFTPEEIEKLNKRVEFYGVLIKIRKALGLTQRQMSEIADMKQPMLARFETGENVPKLTTASKLLKPFGLSLAIVSDKTDKVIHKFK